MCWRDVTPTCNTKLGLQHKFKIIVLNPNSKYMPCCFAKPPIFTPGKENKQGKIILKVRCSTFDFQKNTGDVYDVSGLPLWMGEEGLAEFLA